VEEPREDRLRLGHSRRRQRLTAEKIAAEPIGHSQRIAIAAVTDPELALAGIREPAQTEAAFAAMAKQGAQAVIVQDSVILSRFSEQVAALALKHRLPSISQSPRFAERGGLLQYGADVSEMFRRSAVHVDKILKGSKAGDLPIEQPTKVGLIVNQRTAQALGLTLPPVILVRADQVIE
jgi:putative tryptophan/tyrosine transport system substrate-binding protein